MSLVSIGLVIGVLFIGMALLFKATAAPFHMWAPDVYEGSPTIVSTFFAVVPKIAILGLFLRLFMFGFYGFSRFLATIINSLLINFYGFSCTNCFKQRKLKRFFAYSSVGHVGYLLIGFLQVLLKVFML